MTREWQLTTLGENSELIIGVRMGGREEESGLGEIGPASEHLHIRIADHMSTRNCNNRHRVAEIGSIFVGAEYVHLMK